MQRRTQADNLTNIAPKSRAKLIEKKNQSGIQETFSVPTESRERKSEYQYGFVNG